MVMTLGGRKRWGVVYTPDWVVGVILDGVLPLGGEGLAGAAVCDPACGDGAFLAGAARRALARLGREDALAVLRRMSGFDIDGGAIARCRARLDALLEEWYPGERVRWRLRERDAFDRAAWRGDRGRFTHIVGNPPYVRVQHLERSGRRRIAGQWQVVRGATDSYLIFYELGLDLLRDGGMLGYIAPSSWLRSDSGLELRKLLVGGHRGRKVMDFGEHQVFDDVTTYTAIVIIEKGGEPGDVPAERFDGSGFRAAGSIVIDGGDPGRAWAAFTDGERERMGRLMARGPRLLDIADIHVGVQTLADDVFIFPAAERESRGLESWILRDIVKASVMKDGRDPVARLAIFPYSADGKLLAEDYIAEYAPGVYGWLSANKRRLLGRDKGRFDPGRWYGYGRQVSIVSGFGDKILTSGMNRAPNFQRYSDVGATFYSGYCVKPKVPVDMGRLLAALNSEDMDFFIRHTSRPYQGGWRSYAKSFIKDFPMPLGVLAGES